MRSRLLNAQQIQQQLESMQYWDARVLQLDSKYFGDEVTLVFEDSDGNVHIRFEGCFTFSYSTSLEDREKPLKEMTLSQIPYFIQNIEICEVVVDNKKVFKCTIELPPLNLEISCNSILVSREQ